MTTTDPTTTSTSPLPGSDVQTGALRRFGSLVWAETRILFRNRTAAFTALVEVARKALPADVNAPVA